MSRLNKMLKQFDRGSSRALEVNDGEEIEIRLLPAYPKEYIQKAKDLGAQIDPMSGIMVFTKHNWLPMLGKDNKDDKGKLRKTSYRCKKDLKRPCAFCEFFENLPREDKELKYKHGRTAKGCCDVLVVETGDIKRWFLGKKLMTRMEEIMDLYPELNHPKRGRSLFLRRKGTQLNTEWFLKVGKKPIEVTLPDDLPDILDELGNCKILKDTAIQKVLDLVWEPVDGD